MNYYISDLHFGHKNILRLNNRPFSSIEEMDRAYINNWNEVVSSNDDVYILGDFAYKSGDPVKYIQQLKGKKHLIIGNHDGSLLKNKSALSMFESIDYYLDIPDENTRVIMFHYPILEWNGYFRNAVHLYGHIHNNTKNDTHSIMIKRKNSYNVGVYFRGIQEHFRM